jgi:type IV secretory pathway TrbF-like protein
MSVFSKTPPKYKAEPGIETPFIKNGKDWDKPLGQYVFRAYKWRLTSIVSLMIGLVFGFLYLNQRMKPVLLPTAYTVKQITGEMALAKPLKPRYRLSKKNIVGYSQEWVKLLMDTSAKQNVPLLSKAAQKARQDYQQQHNSLPLSDQRIDIAGINDADPKKIVVQWDHLVGNGKDWSIVNTYQGRISIKQVYVGAPLKMTNPLGIKITHFTWRALSAQPPPK